MAGIDPELLVLGGVVSGLLVLAISYLVLIHIKWRACSNRTCMSGERVFVRSQDNECSLLYGYIHCGCLSMDSNSLLIKNDGDQLKLSRGSVRVEWTAVPKLRALLPSIRIRGDGATVVLAARDSIFDPDTYSKTKNLFETLAAWVGEFQEGS